MESETQDELINGPEVAAQIILRMDENTQERLVQAIAESAPELAGQIEARLFDITKITALAPQSIQRAIAHVESRDVAITLKAASVDERQDIIGRLTPEQRSEIIEEYKTLPKVNISDVRASRRRVLRAISEHAESKLQRQIVKTRIA